MENTKESRGKFMRLYNIYYVCKTCLPLIEKVRMEEIRSNGVLTGYYIRGWKEGKKTLAELNKIKFLKEYVNEMCHNLNFVAIELDEPQVAKEVGERFNRDCEKLKIVMKATIQLYDSMELDEFKNGIDIKIPKCESLKEYVGYLKEIDFIFTQCPYLLSSEEEIKFNNVDVGSQWLSFALITAGTFGILNNLAKLVDKAIAIKSHLLTLRQQEEMLKTMNQKNEATEETIDVFKKMKRITMEGYVKDLESDMGELENGEERGKVEMTLEKLGNLLDKGVEIYSSIETPNEVKSLFPMNADNPILPDNIVKLLEQKESKEE